MQEPAVEDMPQEPHIEDLPLDKKLEVLKKYNPVDYYIKDNYIDAQDTVNTWCLSQVSEILDPRNIRVHYDGWSSKWDVTLKTHMYKVAPFRKYSKGYTGQMKVALRQNLKFNLDDLHIQKQKIEKLIQDDLNGLGAFQTTQYIRGELYTYVDFLLQNGSYNSTEYVDAINDFLYHILRLIVTWLKKCTKLIPLYSQLKVNSDLFLIDENIAILQCAYEFFDILKKLFCGCLRCIKYYILNDREAISFENDQITLKFEDRKFEELVKKDEEDIDTDAYKSIISNRKELVFGQFLNFVNAFAREGGFDSLIDFLRAGNEGSEDRMPLEMISLLVSPLRTCHSILSPTFSNQLVATVRDIVLQRISNMTEKELKEIDKESASRVLGELKDFFTLSMTDVETAELIEKNQLNIALRFLKSTYLEKRLKGISEIKGMIEKIETAQYQAAQKKNNFKSSNEFDKIMSSVKVPKGPKYINAESLKEWILQNKLLEIVFGENTHLEIVKRSSCILKFLAKQGALPCESVDLLWRCQLGKHEEMVRVVYSTIQDLVPNIDIALVSDFFERIRQVPASQFDDKFLDFLKDFTLKALDNYYEASRTAESAMAEAQPQSFEELVRKREADVVGAIGKYLSAPSTWDSDCKQFGLPIFWELIQDKATKISAELTQQSIACITEILKQPFSQPVKVSYLVRALDNLLKGESVAQSTVIAQSIISDYPSQLQSMDGQLSESGIILSLQTQIDLIGRVIGNIETYNNAVRERIKQYSEKKKALPDDISNFVFVGKHPHHQTLNLLLGFLEFLIVNSENQVSLGIDNIDRLWHFFVQQPNFNADQTLFLKWINKHRETGGTYDKREYFLFNEEERKHFFAKILCNPTYVDFKKISIGQVKCFHKFFKVINQEEGFLQHVGRKLLVLDHIALIGLDTLRRIAVESENDRSREESMDLLVDLHLKLDPQRFSIDQQAFIWGSFVDNCMEQLESENDPLVSNTLLMLSKFLDRYEGKKTLKPEMKNTSYNNYQPSPITVIFKPDLVKKQVQISYQQTIGFLRVKIAEAFGFHINEFNLSMKSQFVDPDEDDDKYYRDVGLVQSVLIMKNPNYIIENHPKNLISQKQENYDKLFALLSKETKPLLVEAAWVLLQKLPVNIKLQQEIKDLSGMSSINDNQQIWEKILDSKSINKLLYSLQIVSQHSSRKDQKPNQWRFKFIQMGGLNYLLRTFLNLNVKSIESNLTLKCIELLILTLHEIMIADKDKEKDQHSQSLQVFLEKKEQIVHTCIKMVDLICDYSIAQEKKRGESYEEINKRILLNKMKKNKYKSYMAQNVKSADKQPAQQEDEEDFESQEYNMMQQISKQFIEQQQIVVYLFKFIQVTIFNHDKTAATIVAGYENLPNMLLKSVVEVENFHIRIEVLKKMKEFISLRSGCPDMDRMIRIVSILSFEIQPATNELEQRCSQYYEGLTQIIDGLTPEDIKVLKAQFVRMIKDLSVFIFERETKEKNTHETDFLMIGKMKLLRSLLQKFPQEKQQVGDFLTLHLIHNCLFEIPQGGSTKSQKKAGPPKCKSLNSRSNALKLLGVLCRDCTPNLNLVLNYLTEFNQNPSWRTSKEIDWNISLMDSEKSSTGFVGLKNLGCICYMNSLFQQIFMINSLRNDLLMVKDVGQGEKDDNMFYQLQLLFAGLLKSEKQYVNPKGFCHSFKDWEGNAVNVLEQMDVEEFFNMLMDRIETAVKGSPQQRTIQQHFGGQFASEMICKGCPHKYERQEAFLSLSIPVKNQKSIQQSLNAFIQGEMLEGDNAYLCEKCDKKVDTLKRTCIKKNPKNLIVALRRFEFDYDKMIRVKVNDYCEFPMELSLEPYTQEGLSRRERIQKLKDEKGEEDNQAAIEAIENEPLKYPKEYYDYSLSGIVVHSGTADSGHYYSFIKDREHAESNKWYEMNDHIVRDFDPNDIPSECFGGEDVFQGYNMMQMKTMKWRNAYLLFYERNIATDIISDEDKEPENPISSETDVVVTKDEDVEMAMSSRGLLLTPSTTNYQIPSEIETKIVYENQKYWQNRFLFGNEYHEFVYDISLNWNTSNLIPKNYLSKNSDFHLLNMKCPSEYEKDMSIIDPQDVKVPMNEKEVQEFEFRVFKFAATFYITILQRAQAKQYVPQMLNLLKSYINKNVKCAQWFLQEFTNFQILEENVLLCFNKEMRKFTVGLLYCSMLKIYPQEKQLIKDYWRDPSVAENNKTVIGNFTLILIQNLLEVKKYNSNLPQYFLLLSRLSSLGPEIREFILRLKGIGRMMEFFFDEFSPHKELFREMTDIYPNYQEKPEMGLPTQVDGKQMNTYQEILEKKRIKALADGVPKYKYLFEAVSNCIRAFKIGGSRSPYQTDSCHFEGLSQQEKDLYFPDPKFLKMCFNYAKKNKAIKALCSGYAHYCYNDKDDFHQILTLIQVGLQENDSLADIKAYMTMLQYLLQKPGGDRQEARFDKTMMVFLECLDNNKLYYKFMEAALEFFFRFAGGIPAVLQWLTANKDKWQWLVEWCQTVSYPIDQSTNVRLYKKRQQFQPYQQYLKSEAFKNQFLLGSRIERMKMILRGDSPAHQTELETSLFDMEDYKFRVGEQIEVYTRKTDTVQVAEVSLVLDEMLHVKYLTVQTDGYGQAASNLQWIACDTDKFQTMNAWKTQYRVKLIGILESQHENNIVRNQEANRLNASQMRQGDGDHEMIGGDNNNQNYNNNNQYPSDEGEEENDSDSENHDMYN